MSALYVFLRHLTALIYPARCPVCGKVISADGTFCDNCMDELIPYNGSFRMKNVRKFIASFEYNEKISPAVFIMKDSICGNAPYAFGKILSGLIKSEGITVDFIVPVPMFKADIKQRGYNQAELIAVNIGRFLDIDVRSDIVIKNRRTLAQKSLTKAERRVNLKNAFSITDISAIKGKRILVVDDVCTTGSTLQEITNLLINSGASEIYCVCACKTPDKQKEKPKN